MAVQSDSAVDRRERPLVYSCSGCSSSAQMTNWLAVQLDRRGIAEMSCIAGVGGDVPSLVRKATSGRPIIVIDGCSLLCAGNCLARHDVTPAVHFRLTEAGVRKRLGEDFDPEQAEEVLGRLVADLDEVFSAEGAAAAAGHRCACGSGGKGGCGGGGGSNGPGAAEAAEAPEAIETVEAAETAETAEAGSNGA